MRDGKLEVQHSIPYSDLTSLDEATRRRVITDKREPLEFGHTLQDQIGGQTDAGFAITGLYEDHYTKGESDPLSRYLPTFLATAAVK